MKRTTSAQRRTLPWELKLGFAVLIGLVLIAAYSLTPFADTSSYSRDVFAGASLGHPLGTDNLGRDTLSRISASLLTGMTIAVVATALAAAIGTLLGLIAGYFGGLWDAIIMRAVDLFLAIPGILLALMVKAIAGPGVGPMILTMAVVLAPVFARIMRGPILSLRERSFVLAAELSGQPRTSIAFKHLLPNSLTPLFVTFAGVAGETVVLEAALSYLGQGIQAPDPSAGRMINEFQKYMMADPALVIIPAVSIFLQVAVWSLLADGLQTMLAPRRDQTAQPKRSLSMRGLLLGRRPVLARTPLTTTKGMK